jgi:hypothetical protein
MYVTLISLNRKGAAVELLREQQQHHNVKQGSFETLAGSVSWTLRQEYMYYRSLIA